MKKRKQNDKIRISKNGMQMKCEDRTKQQQKQRIRHRKKSCENATKDLNNQTRTKTMKKRQIR